MHCGGNEIGTPFRRSASARVAYSIRGHLPTFALSIVLRAQVSKRERCEMTPASSVGAA